MNHIKKLLLLIFVGLLAGYTGSYFAPKNIAQTATAKKESVYERVLRTKTLRCGYATWEPMIIIDPNTKQLSGIAHDVIEAAAKKLSLKVEWTEEVGWGEYVTALDNKRFDVMCTGGWPNSQRARIIQFTQPFAYSPLNVYVRANDTRFDNNLAAINNAATSISTLEGSTANIVAAESFPLAKTLVLPELSSVADVFMNVTTKKADATILDAASGQNFINKQPGKLKIAEGGQNVRVFPNVFHVARGEYELQQMLNVALTELGNAGITQKIIDKYMPGAYYTPQTPYKN
jgi:polar amino acid transport system substrate-binding protein